jgi:hypothetical protein
MTLGGPGPTLTLATAQHGDVVFTLVTNKHRREIIAKRAPRVPDVSPELFVEAVAAASLQHLAGRAYEPSDPDTRTQLAVLRLNLTDEERQQFATQYLAANEQLTCKSESTRSPPGPDGVPVVKIRWVPRDDITWPPDAVAKLHLAWVTRERERLEQFRDPLRELFGATEMFRNHHAFTDLLARVESPAIRSLGMIPDIRNMLPSTTDALRALSPLSTLASEFARPSFVSFAEQFERLVPSRPLLEMKQLLSARPVFADILKDAGTWHALDALSSPVLPTLAAHGLYDTTVSRLLDQVAAHGLGTSHLASRVLAPSHAFTRFVDETSRLALSSTPQLGSVFDSILGFSARHYGATSTALERFIDSFEAPQAEREDRERTDDCDLNLFPEQRADVLRRAEVTPQAAGEELVAASPIARVGTLAAEVLLLVADCNEASLVRGVPMFKTTTRSLRAAVDLCQVAPTDRHTFGTLIDDLFFLLYEGAGSAHLRFLRAAGGVFDPEEEAVKAVFQLKFLRNKWLRHDAEHGSERDIKKSWSDLGQTVRALGLAGIPRTPDQYLALYLELLSRIRSFLIELLSRLQN